MKPFSKLPRILAAALIGLCAATSNAANAPHYLITNNDNSQGNSASVYTILGNTFLEQAAVIKTGAPESMASAPLPLSA